MRTPRRTKDAGVPAPPTAVRGRRAHAGQPADEAEERAPGASPVVDGAWAASPDADGPAAPAGPPASEGPTGPAEPIGSAGSTAPAEPSVPGGDRVRSAPRPGPRPRTVRAKIVSLLMVPVVSLLALWGFATVTTAQEIARLRQLQRLDTEVREPVSAALTALQAERRAAVRQVAAPGAHRAAELKDRMRGTDEAVDRLRLGATHTVGDTGDLPDEVADRVSAFVGKVEGLALLRTAAADGRADWDQVYAEYTGTISAAFAVCGALAGVQDGERGADARVLLEFGRAGEMLSREDALLGSARLGGLLTADRLRAFSGAAETRRTLIASATADLPAAGRAAWTRLATGADHTRLIRAEDRIRAATPGRPAARAVTSTDWDAPLAAVRDGLAAIEADARTGAADRTDPFAGGALTSGGAAVAFGLVAVGASLLVSVRIGRGLVVELVGLRNTALGIARRELPAAMRRLRAGEEIDIRAEAPAGPDSEDEIGQVGEALATVHRAALSAAVERAELADGISGVFVNLARRSQVLVHRQLNLLDAMERRADDPGELDDLFRLDHLTTRMRRHAESLIILSGAAPGRAWRRPVPLTDVVRAAVSEIEDYARVEMPRLPETAVVGGAVADLTHLLAELIENATQFSPPHTKVRVSGEPVGNGYVLEIEDRGLGMGRESLAEANARIARTEDLDLFDSDRLGLFVVSRLSSRHDVKVHLRTSPYGGTTAVVLLPTDVLQGALPPGRGEPADGPGTPRTGPPYGEGTRARVSVTGDVGGPRTDEPRTTREHGNARGREEVGRYGEVRQREDAPRAEVRRLDRIQPPRSSAERPGPTPTEDVHRAAPRPQGSGGRHGNPARQPDGPRPPSPRIPAPSRPQPLPRPTAVPALAARPESGPAPAGVTALRPRGSSVPPPTRERREQREQPPGTPAGGPDAPGDPDGRLPRRVRQASLVPQLREAPAREQAPAPVAPGADARTPERVRERMAAYQDGRRRGGGPAPGGRRPLGTGAGHDGGRPGPTSPHAPHPEGDDA
ncbi:sensor histidine kinase [Streptomyces sp. NRRL F-6491]|uniref:sensor histidine kinase n=1 Tax=Streptomyces sp. NRRL F-6491 TaxID=1519495 RepID=UPI0006AF2519|nr:sensor histidine kinase [Streptomyces sp. NRRL F-6491]KOX17190.1 histidine kinase [Streptomyces sp. NRRL F-6491]